MTHSPEQEADSDGAPAPKIDILLSLYKGAGFVLEQLNSLDAQTYRNWRLILRDDGPDDGGLKLTQEWAESTGHDVLLISDSDTRLGPMQSFARLLEHSDAPYFAFCDQDDVWHPDKLTRLIDEMQALEDRFDTDIPLLVHSDLYVVNENMAPTGTQFWDQSQLSNTTAGRTQDQQKARAGLLLQNVVTGCATLGNARLRELAHPMPDGARMHDYWVALIAAHLGHLQGVAEPLIYYRQHSANTVGAKSWGGMQVLVQAMFKPLRVMRQTRDLIQSLQQQARCFLEQFEDQLDAHDKAVLKEFSTLQDAGFLRRKTFMFRHGTFPQTRMRGLAILLII